MPIAGRFFCSFQCMLGWHAVICIRIMYTFVQNTKFLHRHTRNVISYGVESLLLYYVEIGEYGTRFPWPASKPA